MKTIAPVTSHMLVLLAILVITSTVQAQATRTWVSGVGDDVNPCSRTAPCKTFAGAITKTARGGEISVLDPGGFGAITITKSVTIDGTATMASILGSSVNAIVVNITDAADVAKTVRIRGLSINGASTGLQGVKVIAASKVVIENSVIDGFKDGVGVAAAGAAQVFIKSSVIRNNSGAGISVVAAGNQVAISDVAVVFNGVGLTTGAGGTIVSFRNNIIYGNKKDGEPTSFLAPR
nr:Right handed beta helix region [uncultured bacterium]